MADDDATLLDIFRELTAADPGRDHSVLLNAVAEFERKALVSLKVSPFAAAASMRPVRFRIFGKLDGLPTVVGCSCSDVPGEDEESLGVLERTVASLPEGAATDADTIRAVLASDLGTIVMLVIFKNEADDWVRFIFHHPMLTKDQAVRLVRDLESGVPSFGPS